MNVLVYIAENCDDPKESSDT